MLYLSPVMLENNLNYENINISGLNIKSMPIMNISIPPNNREYFTYLVVIPVIWNVIIATKNTNKSSSIKNKI